MKKQYKFLSGILAIISCVSIVGAQNLGDLMDNLGTSVSFGYTSEKKVAVKTIANTVVTLQSPLIRDGSGNAVTAYTVMYSQYPLTEILEKTDLLNQTKEVGIVLAENKDPFTMDINIENADKSKKYYLFVIPNDASKNLGQISNEVWVNLSNQTYGDVGDPTGTSATSHSAADVDMSLAHISHTLNGNNISLTWSAIAGSKTIQIDVMKPGESLFSRVTTVNMNDEKYTYAADKNGEYVFRFIAVDCATQVNYTVTMGSATQTPPAATPTKPIITKVPKTGPAENFIVILLVAGLLYLGYSKFYRKTK